MSQGQPQGIYTYRNPGVRVILIVLGVLIPSCVIALLMVMPAGKSPLPEVLFAGVFGTQYGYLLLRYLNASIAITQDAVESVNLFKKVTRIRFEDVVSVIFPQPGTRGPLATIASLNDKIRIQIGIDDWSKLRDALRALNLSENS